MGRIETIYPQSEMCALNTLVLWHTAYDADIVSHKQVPVRFNSMWELEVNGRFRQVRMLSSILQL